MKPSKQKGMDLRGAIECPNGQMVEEWIAENTENFFNDLLGLYRMV